MRGPLGLTTTCVAALCSTLTLGGCLLGPDYVRPELAEPGAWHEPLGDGLSAAATDRKQLASWWTVLDDPELSDLVARAVAGNLDVSAARERVHQADEQRAAAQAAEWPVVTAKVLAAPATASHSSAAQGTGFQLSWLLDVFGKLRRGVEAAKADEAASQESLHDALVGVVAEVVQSYVDLRVTQAHLAIAQENLAADLDTAQLASWRMQAGLTTVLDVDRANADVARSRAQLPTLRAALDEAENRLAILVGEPPGALAEELDPVRPIPTVPAKVAVGVPAEALAQRPDVRRAERQLAAETARVGATMANAYPSISLTGAVGIGAIVPATFTSGVSVGAAAAAQAVQVLFDHGGIKATIRGQKAVRAESLEHFKSTVLSALDDVENSISEYSQEREREKQLADASESAQSAATLSRQRYAAGLVDFQVVLDAERTFYSTQEQQLASQGRVVTDLVSLYRSLGGGWREEV